MECLTSSAHFKQQASNEFQFYPSSVFILTFASVLLYYTNDETPLTYELLFISKRMFKSPLHNIKYINTAGYFEGLRVRLSVQACRTEVHEPLCSPLPWQEEDFITALVLFLVGDVSIST